MQILSILLLLTAAAAQDTPQVTGKVVDTDGKPVAGVRVGIYSSFSEDRIKLRWPHHHGKKYEDKVIKTAEDGTFTGRYRGGKRPVALIAYDEKGNRGGIALIQPDAKEKTCTITLSPMVKVHGKVDSKELGRKPSWMNCIVQIGKKHTWIGSCISRTAEFAVQVPAGEYQLWIYGTDVKNHLQKISVAEEELDLGTIDLKATIIAKHYGKAPPEWTVSDARGAKKEVKLSDYKDKWVLIEFWGFWCGPCTHGSLPKLMKFYEKYKDQRDQFEILAFHDASVKDFDELDGKLEKIIKDRWDGKELPFPILLDSSGTTIKAYGIRGYPTIILIDPEGKLVNGGNPSMLEKKLKKE